MYEFYRTTIIGRSLMETIDRKVKNNIITKDQAQFILLKFDEAVPHVFACSVTTNFSFKASILSYNFVDGVWKFLTKDFAMTINNKYYRRDYLKIVACDADTSVDGGRRRRKRT